MAMVALSQEARSHLERYLQQIRTALQEHPSVDADEVERDVLGHIAAELSGQPEPVGATRLLRVLDRLGAPDEWLPADQPAAWQRPFDAVRSGPGDWRLALITFATFVAAPALFMGRVMLWPLPPILFVLSFVLARVTLALFAEHKEPIGPRRWLIYPPLTVWYGGFIVALFGGPALFSAVFASEDGVLRSWLLGWLGEPTAMGIVAALACLLGVWWIVLGLLLTRFVGGVRAVFWPFAERFERRHAVRVAVIGASVVAVSGAMLAVVIWS
jgi:hypothetical protein